MTKINVVWAAGIAIAGAWFGISIMFGSIPGHSSDIGTFERVAALAAMAVETYGNFLTGLGAMIAGLVVGGLCLLSGKGSPDSGLGID